MAPFIGLLPRRWLTTALILTASGSVARPCEAAVPSDSLRFGTVRLATGIRMHFAEQGDTAGPAVIFLHGYTDSWFSFSRILPLLPRTIHAYALDQRGHGGTDRPDSGYAIPDLAADVLAFMDARGIKRAVVVGHSMGSYVAQDLAVAAPDRVERLVLIGSGVGFAHIEGLPELRDAIHALADPVPVDFVREFQYSTIHHPVPEPFMERVIEVSAGVPTRVWRAAIDGQFAVGDRTALGATTIPTLLMWGDRDAIFPRAEQDKLRALVPRASVLLYEETGHAPHWERPERFARDLVAFLAP